VVAPLLVMLMMMNRFSVYKFQHAYTSDIVPIVHTAELTQLSSILLASCLNLLKRGICSALARGDELNMRRSDGNNPLLSSATARQQKATFGRRSTTEIRRRVDLSSWTRERSPASSTAHSFTDVSKPCVKHYRKILPCKRRGKKL